MASEEGIKRPEDTVSYTGGEPCQKKSLEGQGQGGVLVEGVRENWAQILCSEQVKVQARLHESMK